jgi:hypothetical protein
MNLASGACLKPTQDHYSCSGFRHKKKQCDSAHYIRRVVLEQVVLKHIRNVTFFATKHEQRFAEMLERRHASNFKKDLATDKKALSLAEKRITELDGIIAKLFEKNATGVLSDERFAKLSQGYEVEQKELETKVSTLQTQISCQLEASSNVGLFLEKVRKYTNITELTTVMLNELVERIEVHTRSERYSKGVQQITVCFNYVGILDELLHDCSENPEPLPKSPTYLIAETLPYSIANENQSHETAQNG